MPSPFPGMDPYLEGSLWPDLHAALATHIRQQLVPQLRPRYIARLEIYLVEDPNPGPEIGILYPDVEVLQIKSPIAAIPKRFDRQPGSVATTPATLTLPHLEAATIRLIRVEIRDTAHNSLVTCVEILSPVHKREPNLTRYRQKRRRLYQSNVHLLELDLIRRGSRPFNHPRLPETTYLISLTRAQSAVTQLWPLLLQDPLPILPVPLRDPDLDGVLDLPSAFTAVYDAAAYDLSLDYSQPPPPPELSQIDADWIQTLQLTRGD